MVHEIVMMGQGLELLMVRVIARSRACRCALLCAASGDLYSRNRINHCGKSPGHASQASPLAAEIHWLIVYNVVSESS